MQVNGTAPVNHTPTSCFCAELRSLCEPDAAGAKSFLDAIKSQLQLLLEPRYKEHFLGMIVTSAHQNPDQQSTESKAF